MDGLTPSEKWTADWLREVGFEFFDNSPVGRLERRSVDTECKLIIWQDGDFTFEDGEEQSCYLPPLQTKQQVRQLCELFGIELNELEPIGGAS
jgi:hypothetical protein